MSESWEQRVCASIEAIDDNINTHLPRPGTSLSITDQTSCTVLEPFCSPTHRAWNSSNVISPFRRAHVASGLAPPGPLAPLEPSVIMSVIIRLRMERVMRERRASVPANDLGLSTLKWSMMLVLAHAVPTSL